MPKSKRKQRTSNSKSGLIGVYKTSSGKYRAKIRIDGKQKYLGSSYATAKQAAEAYDDEAIKARKPLSTLNYPKRAPVGDTPIQQPLYSSNTVGYRGVCKSGKKFLSKIKIGGNITHLGNYETAKEAAVAYDRAVLKASSVSSYHSTSLLNFPDMVHNLNVEPKRVRHKVSSSGYRG